MGATFIIFQTLAGYVISFQKLLGTHYHTMDIFKSIYEFL